MTSRRVAFDFKGSVSPKQSQWRKCNRDYSKGQSKLDVWRASWKRDKVGQSVSLLTRCPPRCHSCYRLRPHRLIRPSLALEWRVTPCSSHSCTASPAPPCPGLVAAASYWVTCRPGTLKGSDPKHIPRTSFFIPNGIIPLFLSTDETIA